MSDDDYHMIDQFLRRNLDDTEYDAYIAALDRVAALAARAEPVAKVRVHRTGGNAGIAWSAVAVTDGESLPLMPDGAKLYAAPPALPQDAARAEPVWAADGWRQECDDADAVLRLIGLDPERCRTEGGWLNVPKIRTMLRDRALVYLCPAGCGCTWRDNGDGSMSLYGPSSRSCAVCETMPLSKLLPLFAAPPALREAEVEAGIAAMDDVYSHPAQQRAAITEQDREAMRAALRAAAAARGR